MIHAFDVSKDENLLEYGRLLWQRKISHIIQDAGDVQIIAVADASQVNEALRLYGQWQSGEIKPEEGKDSGISVWFNRSAMSNGLFAAFMQTPLTIALIIICITIAMLTLMFDVTDLFNMLLFPDFTRGSTTFNVDRVIDNFTFVQFLKMFTPALLHGGYIHLIFNMLWMWEFGKCIEKQQPSWVLFLVIAFLAFMSNTAQYFASASNNFVGISGVVAGLMGYIAMWKLIDPKKGITLPTSILMFMLIMIIAMAVIDLGFIADTAHVAGLISGAVLGLVMAAQSRIRRVREQGAL